MMKRIKPMLALFLAMQGVTCWAQQFQTAVPEIKPIAPDEAALFKVLERPIGSYTGTVPVNFPLCTLTSGPLSASLSLDYNSTGGVRVEEAASSVGLGFSLSDGAGRITQIVNAVPDDQYNGLLSNAKKPSNFNCSDMFDILVSAKPVDDPSRPDLEADLFLYNFNGQSGTFFFKEDGSVVVSQNSGIKISYNSDFRSTGGIRQWIITDQNGNKYYFGRGKRGGDYYIINDYTYHSVTNNSFQDGVSSRSWYLADAYDINEENSIKYTYVSSSGALSTFSGGLMQLTPGTDCRGFNVLPDEATVTTNMGEYVVSRIDGRSGYILVNSSTGRLDGAWGRKINNIEMYDSANVFKKRFTFNYNYFNSWSTDAAYLRLKLTSFSEFGNTGTDSLTYKFVYNEFNNLPSRFSRSVDFWGFSNGAFNPSYFPNVKYQYGSTTYRKVNYANRFASGAQSQANILTKIIFPTGGYREFVYEGNTALVKQGDQMFYDPGYTTNQSFTRSDFTADIAPTPCLVQFFTVNSTDGGAVFNYNFTNLNGCTNYSVKLFKISTPGQTTGGVEQLNPLGGLNADITVLNGYFRLEVYRPFAGCFSPTINGSWGECTLSTATIATPNGTYSKNNRNVGGVRVKQVKDYDPVSNKINLTEYKYKLYSTDSNYTSGLLVTPVTITAFQNPSSTWCSYLALYSTGCYPLGKQGSSYVVYPEVRTIENGNGWTDEQFNYAEDFLNQGDFPLTPPDDNAIRRGRPLTRRIYAQNGSLLKKTTWAYGFGGIGNQGAIRTKPYYYIISSDQADRDHPAFDNEVPHNADCQPYTTTMEYCVLTTQKDSTFTAAGNYGTQTDYAYYYYNNQMLLKQVKAYINNGAVKQSTYKYPFTPNGDFTFGLTAAEQTTKTTLTNLTYVQPLEIVDSIKPLSGASILLGGTKYVFNTFNGNELHVAKVRTYTSLTDSNEVNLSAYDIAGNLTERYNTNDVTEVYLWGYKNAYPVAKVTGSTYAAVSALVSNATIQNLGTNDVAMRTELNKIRTGLAGTKAQVYTYTYSPLVGMTSQTDPTGKTVYYEYDNHGRLMHIRDQNNSIIKKFRYTMVGPQ